MNFKYYFLIYFLFSSTTSFAFEVDNFTCRYEKLEDVTEQVNAETNRRLEEVLTKGGIDFPAMGSKMKPAPPGENANFSYDSRPPKPQRGQGVKPQQGSSGTAGMAMNKNFTPPEPVYKPLQGCDKTQLHAALRGALASSWMGNLETWAQRQPFSKCLPKENVYQNTDSGFMLKAAGLNYTIKVNGVNIGADKLSHFMTEGADYYEAQMKGANLKDILSIGENEELGHYGLSATGIKSYGDLVANYQGYTFWKNTTEGNDPYFKCVNNKWVQAKKFDWANFVNPMMDESNNCSKYASQAFEDGVAKNVAALQKKHSATPLTCPIDVSACAKAHEYIPNTTALNAIIHPSCLNPSASTYTEEKNGVAH
ncbi:MAG: hypothetical protein IT287_03400 [Bdellovibrionaceae bacterium]|nr:hypothetical protein [Pseudobdellovibrionaceae bacterium]